jgi:hypothetical protein
MTGFDRCGALNCRNLRRLNLMMSKGSNALMMSKGSNALMMSKGSNALIDDVERLECFDSRQMQQARD